MLPAYAADGRQVDAVDDSSRMAAEFSRWGQAIDIYDGRGKFLGRFLPPPVAPKPPICPWEPGLDKEGIQRRINAPGAMTLDEFWKKMEGR